MRNDYPSMTSSTRAHPLRGIATTGMASALAAVGAAALASDATAAGITAALTGAVLLAVGFATDRVPGPTQGWTSPRERSILVGAVKADFLAWCLVGLLIVVNQHATVLLIGVAAVFVLGGIVAGVFMWNYRLESKPAIAEPSTQAHERGALVADRERSYAAGDARVQGLTYLRRWTSVGVIMNTAVLGVVLAIGGPSWILVMLVGATVAGILSVLTLGLRISALSRIRNKDLP
jgi:hypothetical protein